MVMSVCVDCLCNVTVVISVYWYHCVPFTVLDLCGDVYMVMSVCVDCLCNVTVVISVYWYHSVPFTVLVSVW